MTRNDLINTSLELAAERCEDLTPLVYVRLFALRPELRPLFVRDTSGSVKGEMLARAIEVILDFIDQRLYGANFIKCEIVTHAGYDVPPDDFPLFFEVLRDTVREVVGGDWTAEVAEAWRELLAEIAGTIAQQSETATAS